MWKVIHRVLEASNLLSKFWIWTVSWTKLRTIPVYINMSSVKVIRALCDPATILTGHAVGAISLQLHEGKRKRQRCVTSGARRHWWGACPIRLHRFNLSHTHVQDLAWKQWFLIVVLSPLGRASAEVQTVDNSNVRMWSSILTGRAALSISLQLHEGKGQRQRRGTAKAREHSSGSLSAFQPIFSDWHACSNFLHRDDLFDRALFRFVLYLAVTAS